MKTWDAFYPWVLPQVIGCPEPVVDFHVKQAAIQFLTRSRAWTEALTAVATVANQEAYAFQANVERQVIGIVSSELDGEPLDVGYDSEIEDDSNTGTPTRVWTVDLINFKLWRIPAASGLQVVNSVELAPTQDATGVEDRIFAHHVQRIADWALGDLLDQTGERWADPVRAQEMKHARGATTNRGATVGQMAGQRLRTGRAGL